MQWELKIAHFGQSMIYFERAHSQQINIETKHFLTGTDTLFNNPPLRINDASSLVKERTFVNVFIIEPTTENKSRPPFPSLHIFQQQIST